MSRREDGLVCVCVGVCNFMLYSAMTDLLPVDVGS